jgi:hypothetical protein
MAPDDFWARKRKQEEKEEAEAQERAEDEARKLKQIAGKTGGRPDGPPISIQFDDLVKKIPIAIDQLENLYRQYAVGILARPPVEERSRLDQMMAMLQHSVKPTPADRFRFAGVSQSYNTHKSRWDKLLADIESGKIKRVAGPKKGPQRM